MNFLLVWSELAFDQMGTLVRDLPDRRKEFAATLKLVSTCLQNNPLMQGESREESDRIWFVNDLVVTYRVDEESRAVEVASIRLRRSR